MTSETNVTNEEPFRSVSNVSAIRQKARQDAEVVLDTFWNLDTYPVDPVKIAQDYGAEVFRGDLNDDIDGLFIPARNGYRPKIYVDSDSSHTRQRFTTAHELGHLVEDGEKIQLDRRRDKVAAQGTDPHEIYANEFAASLLMPDFAVRQLVKAGYPLMKLHEFFAVSQIAMSNRLKNLGIA